MPQSKDVQTIAHWLIGKCFDGADNLICKLNTAAYQAIAQMENTKASPLDELLCDLLARGRAGHRLSFDCKEGKWIFETLLGREIPLILSESNHNAYDLEYSEDFQAYQNGGWYEREDGSGSRIWTLIPSSESGILRWTGVLSGSTESEAKSALQKRKWEKKLLAKVKSLPFSFDYSQESYEQGDYHLGDLVKVQKEFGKYKLTEQKRITGMDFWYETNETGMQPVLETDEETGGSL